MSTEDIEIKALSRALAKHGRDKILTSRSCVAALSRLNVLVDKSPEKFHLLFEGERELLDLLLSEELKNSIAFFSVNDIKVIIHCNDSKLADAVSSKINNKLLHS